MAIPCIEAEGSKNGNLYSFETSNINWVPENMMLRNLVISEATRMAFKYFLRHRLSFQYDSISGNPKRITRQSGKLQFKYSSSTLSLRIKIIKE